MTTTWLRTARRARRVLDRRVLGVVIAGLAILAGYQVYAARIQHRNAATAAKVATLSKVQCANTRLFYALFNALAADSSPHFGSPPNGVIVPGARSRLIRELYAAERETTAPLRAQGCRVSIPKDPS